MKPLPDDAFSRLDPKPFEPAARRALSLFGARVELLLLPERGGRRGAPGPTRRPFRPDAATGIIQREAFWRDRGLALTPNLYPFAERQLLLWSSRSQREADAEMLTAAFDFAARHQATVLVNSIGAAASVPRSHLHLIDEQLPFLPALPTRRATESWLMSWEGVDIAWVSAPYPAEMLVLRGNPAERARAIRMMLDLRCCPAFNLCDDGQSSWLFPRSNCEITAPNFPQALGAAEIWGRWCFVDRDAFEAATAERLGEALRLGGFPNPD